MGPDRILIEVELTDFNVDDIRTVHQAVKEEMSLDEVAEDAMNLASKRVHVILWVGPGEKETWDQGFVHAAEGRIVNIRLADQDALRRASRNGGRAT